MLLKSLILVAFLCSLAMMACAANSQPTIGGEPVKVEALMQTKGAVVEAVVGDPKLLKDVGFSAVTANDRIEITNLGNDLFRLVDLKRGQVIVTSCRAWLNALP